MPARGELALWVGSRPGDRERDAAGGPPGRGVRVLSVPVTGVVGRCAVHLEPIGKIVRNIPPVIMNAVTDHSAPFVDTFQGNGG